MRQINLILQILDHLLIVLDESCLLQENKEMYTVKEAKGIQPKTGIYKRNKILCCQKDHHCCVDPMHISHLFVVQKDHHCCVDPMHISHLFVVQKYH